jgi:hypothetical protein
MTTLRVERPAHPVPSPSAVPTRSLVAAGAAAGPVYVGVSLTQALTREAFDLTRHPWSTLANGDLGWIQRTNLAVTGLLVVAFAAGLRTVLGGGRGSRWAPRALTVFGAGMLVAAVFPADPALGFPAGTPADYQEISGTGVAHLAAAGIGFVGVIAACYILARRFSAAGERRWAVASRAVGTLFVVSFVGLSGTRSSVGIVAFTVGVVAVFALDRRARRPLPRRDHGDPLTRRLAPLVPGTPGDWWRQASADGRQRWPGYPVRTMVGLALVKSV